MELNLAMCRKKSHKDGKALLKRLSADVFNCNVIQHLLEKLNLQSLNFWLDMQVSVVSYSADKIFVSIPIAGNECPLSVPGWFRQVDALECLAMQSKVE